MQRMEDGIWRIVAPNPSPLTFRGTNSYLVEAGGERVLIDPGPDDPGHLAALLAAIGGRRLDRILVTHAHLDHSPLARPMAEATGAPVCAFGGPEAGRSAVMRRLAEGGLMGGGEGVDRDFRPDVILADGDRAGPFEAIHTPGHMGNHLCFALGDVVFSGDHVMGWATSLVSPPDGDLTDFMASCARLACRPARVFHPGHGDPVIDPAARLAWIVAHRREREAQIRAALRAGGGTVAALTAAIYTDVAAELLPAAGRNVLAHLVDLAGRGLARAVPELSAAASFEATPDT